MTGFFSANPSVTIKALFKTGVLLLIGAATALSAASSPNHQDYFVSISLSDQTGSATPAQYAVGDNVWLKVTMTNLSTETLNVPKGEDYARPRLMKDGNVLSYKKTVAERVKKQEAGGSYRVTGFLFLKPQEPQYDVIDLSYWYESLQPGYYQVYVERRFFRQTAVSNPIFFEILPATVHAQSAPTDLQVKGTILSGEITEQESGDIKLTLNLSLDFTNSGKQPVLLIKRKPGIVEEKIIADASAAAQKCLFKQETYPSIDRSKEWQFLKTSVDTPSPSSDAIKTLAPNETWTLVTSDWFYIAANGNDYDSNKSWDVIRATSPLWVQVTFETWPKNIEQGPERDERQFGIRLRNRWKSFGDLLLGSVTSEPIPLNISSFSLSSAKNQIKSKY